MTITFSQPLCLSECAHLCSHRACGCGEGEAESCQDSENSTTLQVLSVHIAAALPSRHSHSCCVLSFIKVLFSFLSGFVAAFKSSQYRQDNKEAERGKEGPAFVKLFSGLASLLRMEKGDAQGIFCWGGSWLEGPKGPSPGGLPWGPLLGFGCQEQRMDALRVGVFTDVAVKLFSGFASTAELI